MPTVYLLRHGAHHDVGHRLTGRAEDGGLTELGREQAVRAARAISALRPGGIYSSPRRRTRETAAIVGDQLELPVAIAPALEEIDFGEWTGSSFAELDADPRWQEWNAHRSIAACPGGESMRAAQARALSFAFEAAARHDRPPLLVTHCDIIRALQCWAERRSLDGILSTDCPPASLHRLDLVPEAKAA